jgi:twitching motility protein PilT
VAAADGALAGYDALESVEDLAASQQAWSDDVMTEGELGELLRASAAAVLLEDSEPEPAPASFDTEPESEPASASSSFDIRPEPAFIVVGDDAAQAPQLQEAGADSGFEITSGPAVSGEDMTAARLEAGLPGAGEQREDAASATEPTAQEVARATHEALMAAQEVVRATHEAQMAAQGVNVLEDESAISADERPAAAAGQEISTVSFDEHVPEGQYFEPRPAFDAPAPVTGQAEQAGITAGVPAGGDSLPADPVFTVVATREDVVAEPAASASEAAAPAEPEGEDAPSFRHAGVVVPLRQPRADGAGDAKGGVTAMLQRLLRLAAARGASTVYVVAQSAPMVRVDGEFSVLDGEPSLNTAFVERLLAELTPRARDAAAGPAAEWIADVPEIGRVRCVTFRDHRGPGIIFRMVPSRAIAADHLGLSAEVQALCAEADGLVLVAGGRGSGRSTLLASFVDLVNRTRSDHVITAESQIEFVHENKRSFVSQRDVRGSAEAVAAAVRAACREEPDVLVVEDLRTPELVSLALEAAESGRLVFGSVPAVSAISAVERVLEMFPAERREKAQASLAGVLRGVVSQVLLRRLRGGRVAAREVLINTPAVASLIAEGKTFELHAALENGRRDGMVPFSESLATLVREGTVHPAHAHRKAPDREKFLSILRRDGVDTSVAERLA